MLNHMSTYIKMRMNGLTSRPLRERTYDISAGGQVMQVLHSRFNMNWLTELGITPQVLMDLGSFDGGDAWRMKHTFPNARVITVEADPARIEAVRAALVDTDVEVHNFAACDQDSPVPWFSATVDGAVHAQGSLFQHSDAFQKRFKHVTQADTPITVTGKRFDTFCAEIDVTEIDLLHMDIEGAELSVLRSIGNLRPTLIYLEWRENAFKGHGSSADAQSLLDAMGYRLIANLGDDRLYRLHS
ncbi:FkbM family methyltransferase [Roseovarius aestuarii]|nr:FkbM family methyltransferase [Roseovarius aestuarii]